MYTRAEDNYNVSPPVDYELLGEGVGQAVHGGGPVLAQRVVHVKPVAGDLTQVQLPEERILVIYSPIPCTISL